MSDSPIKSFFPKHTVQVIFITNPFDPNANKDYYDVEYKEGFDVNYYLNQALFKVNPVAATPSNLVVSLNGGDPLETTNGIAVNEYDSIVCCLEVMGGGGGGNKVLRTVGLLAVAIATVATAGLATPFAPFLAAAVGVGGLLAVNTIFPAARPSLDGLAGQDWGENSPTWGWNTSANPSREGAPLPVIIGTTKATPPLIAKHITTQGDKQYLNLLYALGEGRIESIQNIRINNNPIESFRNITYEWRTGTQDQTLIPDFDDVIQQQSVGFKLGERTEVIADDVEDEELTSSWYSFTTPTNSESVSFSVGYPSGLHKTTQREVAVYSYTNSGDHDGGGGGFSGFSGFGGRGGHGLGGGASSSPGVGGGTGSSGDASGGVTA